MSVISRPWKNPQNSPLSCANSPACREKNRPEGTEGLEAGGVFAKRARDRPGGAPAQTMRR